ncbi:hypothetical protein M231_03519 [Tremella mesenterica]|uniref:Trafficking protein particle complex subunit 2 n=1 Tax=Tremella mesenterica TaxID=5217 RepID=A0A4Q1BN89_TREME|nr:hypothetical protein M231_03519 [Tremella mesenterica]
MSFYLAIVSPLDSPLFQLSFQSSKPSSTPTTSSPFPSWSSFSPSDEPVSARSTTQNSTSNGNGTIGSGGTGAGGQVVAERHMQQMIAHASLDSVEEVMEGTGNLYLKNVDRHNEWTVSAFLATSVKFILLHDIKNDDGIRAFFIELWEVYVKVTLNPFHTVNTPIRSPIFEAKVRAAAKRNL